MIELFLPFPPSVNGLYDGGHKSKRRFKSAHYEDWIVAAGNKARRQVKDFKGIDRECEIVISLVKPDKRKRDVANLEKAVTDFLVSFGILQDDCLITRNTQEWATGDFECRVRITPAFTPCEQYLPRMEAMPV